MSAWAFCSSLLPDRQSCQILLLLLSHKSHMARPPAQKPRDTFRISAESWNMYCSGHQPLNPEILSAFLQNPGICTVHQPRNPEILSAFLQNPGICTIVLSNSPATLDAFRISAEAWFWTGKLAPKPWMLSAFLQRQPVPKHWILSSFPQINGTDPATSA